VPGLALQPFLFAVAVVAALAVVYALGRRHLRRRLLRLRVQMLIAAVGVVAYFAFAGGDALPSLVFDVAAFVAAVLAVELAYRLLDALWLGRRSGGGGLGRPAVPRLVRDLGAVAVVLAAVAVAGHAFLGIDYGKFLLPSAVVSAVLGLALQDVLRSVFAGLTLQTERPFELGDWILVDGEPLQVVEMALRSTHLRSNLGVHHREPNANLLASRIVNLGSGVQPVGFAVRVGVAYGSPPGLVCRSLEEAARHAPGVVPEPAPFAFVHDFADSAVTYELRFWTLDVHRLARVEGGVRGRIWYQLHRDGWKIPYPIRTVEIEPARSVAADKRAWRAARAEELLARVDLFAALPDEVRRALAEAAQLRYFDAGEALVEEGAQGDSLMVLARGSVEVWTLGGAGVAGTAGRTAGRRVELAVLGAGDYFGEMSLLTGEPRSATVTARTPCEVYVLGRDELAPILAGDPTVAETLSRVLAERSADTAAHLADPTATVEPADAEQESLLERIRHFFRLGSR
jgi:small-conductance mechanosensitive channel/CRP-like cAMP-binding protein